MPLRKPLVIISGNVQQIPAGDTLDAAVVAVDVIQMTNAEVGAITVGMPVYIFSAGNVKKAKSDASGTSVVIGLVYSASIAAGASGSILTGGFINMADWTTITGAAALVTGSAYYLDPATSGMLTATAPTTVGQFVTFVGLAFSTTDLFVEVERPIGL